MFLGLLRHRAEWKAAIAADARRLIESFNESAYFEARERAGAAVSMARARSPLDRGQALDRQAQGIAIGLAGG